MVSLYCFLEVVGKHMVNKVRLAEEKNSKKTIYVKLNPEQIQSGKVLDSKHRVCTFQVFTLPRSIFAKLASRDGPGTMSSSEIQSWIASSNTSNNINGGSGDSFTWQRDNVFHDWPRSIDFAQGMLLTSKTRVRVQFLQEELLSLARHGGEEPINIRPII